MNRARLSVTGLFLLVFFCCVPSGGAAVGKQPLTVNGDVVEFFSEGREIVAEGNVEIIGQDMRITADKVRVFFDEKLVIADGNVVFKRGTEEAQGDMVIFDFGDRTGTLINPHIRMTPYYGSAAVMEKLGAEQIVLKDSVVSTCDLPHPHYALTCKEVTTEPGKILRAKGTKISILGIPVMYVPSYSHRLTDKRPRFMITPGHRKNYGMELFGSWRYYLNENARGVLHFDWYQKKGWAEGIDLNYDTKLFGVGNAKYYRIDEKDTNKDIPENERRTQERSRIEVQHKWQMTDVDQAILSYYRASDVNFRKDYFYREYETDMQPSSFFLYSHVFPSATLSFLGQPRVNAFESVLQKIPELKLETINQRIGDSRFYFKNTTTSAFLSNTTANSNQNTETMRTDTTNQMSYLFRWAGLEFSPYVGEQNTYYSRGVSGQDSLMRNMFFTGMDMSTKLFKIYDVESNFMKMDIHQLRHVITPSIQYRYQHDPSVSASKIQQMDSIDALDSMNKVTLGLENKLQTKRNGLNVDLLRFLLSSDYNIEDNDTLGKGFQIFKYEMEFRPWSWFEFDSNADYDMVHKHFDTIDAEFWNTSGRLRTHVGYRYAHSESSQMTIGLDCPLNPFWTASVYERFEFKTGDLVEQEYRLTRDMHCWLMEIIINQRESEGVSVMLAFKIKEFPDIGINAEASFSPPRSSQ